MKVVLFCGGRGSASIIRALVRRPDIELTLLVNAYDDGQSTGALRRLIPGMLGPSDFRKNLSWLVGETPFTRLLEYRFPTSQPDLTVASVRGWFAQIPLKVSERLRALLAKFFDHAGAFDYRDCALGNLIFAGAYLAHGNDFNAAIAEIAELAGAPARLLNVAEGSNRILVGLKADGTVLPSEAKIVAPQSPSPITDLYLLTAPPPDLSGLDLEAKRAALAARNGTPKLSPEATDALTQAGVIIYGPGTQQSSLLPSYRIATAALAASTARKLLVINLDSDHDIQGLTTADIVDRAMTYGASVTEVVLDRRLALAGDTYRSARIIRGDFADPANPGLHDGDAVVQHIVP